VFQRADGQWAASISLGYDANGKHLRKTVYAATKTAVMEELKKLQIKAGQLASVDAGAMTVGQLLSQWLDAAKLSVCRGTLATYAQHVNDLLLPKLGAIKLARLNSLHVEGLYRQLADDGHSAARQRHAGVTLRVALSWAVKHRLIPNNPASGKLVALPAHAKREIKPLEAAQIAAFLAAARKDRLHAMYPLAIDSGCRQGELLGLTWADVDFGKGSLTVNRSLEEVGGSLALKEPKTKKSRRTITLSAFTLAALQEHRKAMLAEGNYSADRPVFCGVRSKSWLRKSDVYRHSFAPILKDAGLRFRFHDMRHVCATLLLAAGTDVKTVQERLGHSTPMMTLNVYSHAMAGAQSAAAAKLNAILEGANAAKNGTVQTA
jgi:integrase